MGDMDLAKTAVGNLANTETLTTIDSATTDAAGDQKETEYINTRWSIQLGLYKNDAQTKKAINTKATWTIGKGFKANEITEITLMNIKGNGKDTFNKILENMVRVKQIGGDSFAEIIRDDGQLVNLKPLDPGVMKIIANRKGIIIRYEQMSKTKGGSQKFSPERIFHLSRNRVADEIHGESIIDAVEETIIAKKEAKSDTRKLMHRHVKPIVKFMLDTDNEAKINAFIKKADAALEKGENLYLPMGTVEHEIVSVPANATLNPIPWIQLLESEIYEQTDVPRVVIGGSGEITEAAGKISYLAFEQVVSEDQLELEEQVLSQLNLEIELEFPVSLANELLTNQSKSETMQASTPEDTAVTNMGISPQGGEQSGTPQQA